MKLEQIELDLCVNVVPYPHEEIEDLKETLKETKGVKDYYYDAWKSNIKVFNEMQADLHKERLLTNETLMTAQHWKKQYEELLVEHAKVLEENVKYEKRAGTESDSFLDLLAQHIKLQDKHEGTLQELSAVKLLINYGVMSWKNEI